MRSPALFLVVFSLISSLAVAADPLPYRYWISHEDAEKLASGAVQHRHTLVDLHSLEVKEIGLVSLDLYRIESISPPGREDLMTSKVSRSRYRADCEAMSLALTRIDRFDGKPQAAGSLTGGLLSSFEHDRTLSYREDEQEAYVPEIGTVAYSHVVVACAETKERASELLGGNTLAFIPSDESFWRVFASRQEMIAAHNRVQPDLE